MSKRTDLPAGNLNGSDRLTVELIEPTGKPPNCGDHKADQAHSVHTGTV
jgi:hypothetical protein